MANKFERSLSLRVISSVSVFVLIATLLYVFFAGVNLISGLMLLSAFGGIAGQALYVGESFVDVVASFFEILVESVISIFEGILSIFNF